MRALLLMLFSLLFFSLTLAGCGLDTLLFGEATRGDQLDVPPAAPNIIKGQAPGYDGGAVTFYSGQGDVLDALNTQVAQGGEFTTQSPGNTELVNLVAVVEAGGQAVWGVLPRVPRQKSVLDPPRIWTLGELLPEMALLNAQTTFATLIVLAKARAQDLPLSSVSPGAVSGAVGELMALRTAGDDRVLALAGMVDRITAFASATPVLLPFPADGASYMDPAALGALDYSGDDAPDASTQAFDEALTAALGAFQFNACYPDHEIRLVLMADMRGGVDRNCSTIETFRWAENAPGKSVFVTGSLHKDTPRCAETSGVPPCLTDDVFDAAGLKLGNWVPNKVPLHDDGSQGDAVAGDGIWTLELVLPYWDPGGLDLPGVRIGYKYSFGFTGDGWTATEEWPGNKRILELRDLNGDHLVTRMDHFGDETTNKDKANLLSPARGGCGTVVFPSQITKATCANDSLEAMVDTDNDCELDAWASPGGSAPLTIDCDPASGP